MRLPSIKKYIDFNLVLILAGFYTIFDLVTIGKISYFRAHFPQPNPEPLVDILLNNILIDWLVVITYMIFIAISTKRLLDRNYSWVKIISIHTVLSILIGIVNRIILDLFGIIRGSIDPDKYELRESVHRFMSVIDFSFLIYFAMVFIIYAYYYLKQVKETEKQKNLLETQLVNTRMKVLSAQLQPHFLFNTLNSISVLADLDAKKAKDTIADLSDFLREILYSSDSNEIPLKKELRTLEYYLNILNVRFSTDLKIKKMIDKKLLNHNVPAMLLQPLIENSIKHGYSYEHSDLEILISIQAESNKLIIKIENNGKPLTLSSEDLMKKGVGLSNMNDRLKNLYGDDYNFEIINKVDAKGNFSGVSTMVKIPSYGESKNNLL